MNNTLNRIYDDLESLGIEVVECELKNNQAIASQGGCIALDSRGLASPELCVVLGHECGHFLTGAFYNPYAPYDIKSKAERRAQRAAIRRYIPYDDLIIQMRRGCQTAHELADYYGVTPEAIMMAYYYYRDVLGLSFSK